MRLCECGLADAIVRLYHSAMKQINIPLTDEMWHVLKELSTHLKLRGEKPDSITRLILAPLVDKMPEYEAHLKSLRGARKR